MSRGRAAPAPLPLFAAAPVATKPAPAAGAWRPAAWPFGGLVPRAYRRIIADPPWRFELYSDKGEAKSAQAHYACMPLEDILALPVRQLAHPDGCLLFLWATWPMLPQGLATLEAWGARYVTGGVWNKRTRNGAAAVGTGYRLRSVSEPFLLGAWGDVPLSHLPAPAGHLESWEEACGAPVIDGVVRGHSRKPDDQYALVETIAPAGPGAELFARQSWPGWAPWGNQTDKFTAEVEA